MEMNKLSNKQIKGIQRMEEGFFATFPGVFKLPQGTCDFSWRGQSFQLALLEALIKVFRLKLSV